MNEPVRPPADASVNGLDAVIEAYKREIDRTLLREMLALTPDQRVQRLIAFLRAARELRSAMKDAS